MQHLEEGVLAVGARFSENDRRGRAAGAGTRQIDRFAVRFHFELLQIGRKPRHSLIIGNDGMGRKTPDVAVPNSEQCHQNRDIAFERRLDEMRVDILAAEQELLEISPGRCRSRANSPIDDQIE